MKPPLAESPFVRHLDYGSGKDGYWTYRHMVIQIEDCIDCLKVTHPDFDYVFELDHSSGHDAERSDGLTTATGQLNWSYGGQQRMMRDSTLTDGSTQRFHFVEGDEPPIVKVDAPKYDITLAATDKEFPAAKLKKILEEK